MKRFYLLKADGIRFRPIGAPSLDSKMISKSLNDLLYLIQYKNFKDFQHGFRPYRGTHTVTMAIFKDIVDRGHTDIFEYDLKGFFNQINAK